MHGLQFDRVRSKNLTCTPGIYRIEKTWTWSSWVRRADPQETLQELFSGYLNSASEYLNIRFLRTDKFMVYGSTDSASLVENIARFKHLTDESRWMRSSRCF